MRPEQEKAVMQRCLAIEDLHKEFSQKLVECQNLRAAAQKLYNAAEQRHWATERIIAERTRSFPWLAKAIAEYDQLCDFRVAEYLENKLRPASSAAEKVRTVSRETRRIRRKFIFALNRVMYYENLFPWLRDYFGEDLDELVESLNSTDDESEAESQDPVLKWIPRAEYESLPESERNQVALDRYNSRPKKSWEIGVDYERYIGFCYEEQGYRVKYIGATEGLEDLGRDLIAENGDEILVIQCKYWRRERILREKHVFQLYGTTIEYFLKHGGIPPKNEPLLFPSRAMFSTVVPVLVTSTQLSDEARGFAKSLGVRVDEGRDYIADYPQIKCNISKSNRQKIYHLPFDQQYDRTVIAPKEGECYTKTVEEAEALGFRRAWRWRPSAGD